VKIEDWEFKEALPHTEIFKVLLDAWVAKHGTKTSFALETKQSTQKISDMYAGRRPVPWWMFTILFRDLNMEIVVNGYGISVRECTRKKYDIDWRVALPEEF
jgi:hypothetical protein